MTTLRQAAEMVLEAWSDPQGMPKLCKALDALREALAQPEQEPTCYLFNTNRECLLPSEIDQEMFKEHPELYTPLYSQPPEGWQLVPKEPTGKMKAYGCLVEIGDYENGYYALIGYEVARIYRAMLEAAPEYKP